MTAIETRTPPLTLVLDGRQPSSRVGSEEEEAESNRGMVRRAWAAANPTVLPEAGK